MSARSAGLVLCAALSLSGCGYSSLQQQDEDVKASWSEVVSLYQRRADLIRDRLSTLSIGHIGVWLILSEGAWSQS